jgi:hypothetical protein
MGFRSPSAHEVREVHSTRACLTRYVPPAGFLTLLTACSFPSPPALFHAGNARGVSPSRAFPSRGAVAPLGTRNPHDVQPDKQDASSGPGTPSGSPLHILGRLRPPMARCSPGLPSSLRLSPDSRKACPPKETPRTSHGLGEARLPPSGDQGRLSSARELHCPAESLREPAGPLSLETGLASMRFARLVERLEWPPVFRLPPHLRPTTSG